MMKAKRELKTKVFFLLLLTIVSQGMSFAQPVSRETAQQAAKTFLDNNGASSAELADVSAAAGFDHLYVFTTGNSFVLMAADSRVQPVLGYSLNGGFDTEGMPDNKKAWIQEYSDGIQYVIEHQTRASAETSQQWRALLDGDADAGRATTVVGPLITTKWNQDNPYNLLCPSGSVTGCVATAMAQVMKYWNYPEHGIGNHSYVHATYGELSADFQNTTYDWANMTNTYSNSSTQTQKMAVATLMYHCGVSVNMNYSPGGSGASTAAVADALKTYFNYSSDVQHLDRSAYSDDNEWIALLKAELDLQRPIQYHGTGDGGGHSFVFDGYNDDKKFHVNWGWGGYCDEYYVITNLNPGPGGIGSGSHGIYNDGQGAVIGIHPSECTAGVPTNLSFSLNGIQNLTLNWDAATGAASYNIYRNGSLIGNSTTNTFSEAAPFGSNEYYVRSVDANGGLSLSSNTVTMTVEYQTPLVTDLAATVIGNDVHLSWTAPEWCYPETPSATLTYGDGVYSNSLGYNGQRNMYWGQRFLASELEEHQGDVIYKVSFYASIAGDYECFIYKGTNTYNSNGTDYVYPKTQIASVSFNTATGWTDINLNEPLDIDATQDLWVFIHDTEMKTYPASFCVFSSHIEGCYYTSYEPSNALLNNLSGVAWLIRTYLTDGVYTYNLYRDGSVIAGPIDDTQYTDSALPDGTYAYYVKTNYYGGETEASNTVTVTLATQTVTLNEGWTWWAPTVATTLAELETALGDNGILINSQESGFARYENGSWSGTLQGFEPGQMYRIETQSAATITLTGTPATPNTLNFLPGHNWFGYTGTATTPIADALVGFEPNEGDQIIGQEGTATFNGRGWSGDLTTLVPGRGYVYVSNPQPSKK